MVFARRNSFPPKKRDLPPPAEPPRLYRPVNFTACNDKNMTIEKNPPTRNANFRNLARGEQCTGKLYGNYCHCDPATTVLAHTNSLSDGKGMAQKAHDHLGMFLGSDCHAWLDQGKGTAQDKAAFTVKAQARTQERVAEIASDPMARPWKRQAAAWALEQLKEQA